MTIVINSCCRDCSECRSGNGSVNSFSSLACRPVPFYVRREYRIRTREDREGAQSFGL